MPRLVGAFSERASDRLSIFDFVLFQCPGWLGPSVNWAMDRNQHIITRLFQCPGWLGPSVNILMKRAWANNTLFQCPGWLGPSVNSIAASSRSANWRQVFQCP